MRWVHFKCLASASFNVDAKGNISQKSVTNFPNSKISRNVIKDILKHAKDFHQENFVDFRRIVPTTTKQKIRRSRKN